MSESEEEALLSEAEVDALLDAAPWRQNKSFSWEVVLFCGFGWISDGLEGQVMSFMLPVLEDYWSLSASQLAVTASTVAAGQAVGALVFGSFADAAGRRPAYLCSLMGSSLFSVLCFIAPNWYVYLLLRTLAGVCVGGNLPLAVTTASEALPPKRRATTIVLLHSFFELGESATIGLAAFCLPKNWRYFVAFTALPGALAAFYAVFRLDESPTWLARLPLDDPRRCRLPKILRRAGALPSTAQIIIRQPSLHHVQEEDQGSSQQQQQRDANNALKKEKNLFLTEPKKEGGCCVSMRKNMALLGSTRQRRTVATSLAFLWFFAQVGSGWATWINEICKKRRIPRGDTLAFLAVARALSLGAFVVAALAIRPPTNEGSREEKSPRLEEPDLKKAPSSASVGTSALGPLMKFIAATFLGSAALTLCVRTADTASALSVALSYCAFIAAYAGVWPIFYVVTPLAFPVACRGAGFGLASAASKVGAVLQPQLASLLVDRSLFLLGILFSAAWLIVLQCCFILRAALLQKQQQQQQQQKASPRDIENLLENDDRVFLDPASRDHVPVPRTTITSTTADSDFGHDDLSLGWQHQSNPLRPLLPPNNNNNNSNTTTTGAK